MNESKERIASTIQPSGRWLRLLTCGLLVFCISAWFHAPAAEAGDPDLTVHEWGTFTAIAGKDGQAVEWMPLTGSTDLPSFVEHFREGNFKRGLLGTIRMETPVLYFYSSHDMSVSVKVRFSKGIITEWYPHATRVEPSNTLNDWTLHQLQTDGSIAWDAVTVSPDLAPDFPHDARENHYYAARETSAAPLRVRTPAGERQEKFLFYRGVSAFSLPISARLNPDGKLLVKNLSKEEEVRTIILFERRGEKVGYRIAKGLQDETTLDPPDLTSTEDSLCGDLEVILVAEGLYPDEAHAMVETWRHSWLEEGSRLFYVVPAGFVNRVLPLTIHPVPAQTVRVFVGRVEIVTPATEKEVESAFASHDMTTLKTYGRFLEPITRRMMEEESHPASARQLSRYLDSLYSSPFVQQ
jgi:hypothetical protein